MLFEKLLKMASQLSMLILMARLLSPDEVGQLMYCFALASIFLFLNQLGLDTLLVKKFIDQSSAKLSLFRHAFFGRVCASIVCIIIINISGIWLVDIEYRLMLFIISLYHLFLPFSTFEWYYQAEGRSDISAIGLICGHIAGLGLRLLCLMSTPDLLILASAYVLEVFVTAVFYLFVGRSREVTLSKEIDKSKVIALIKESFILMVSGAVILIYMKIDQLMLGYLSESKDVAYYVSATRLSEAWYFFGLTIIGVYMPKILYMKRMEDGYVQFEKCFIKMGRILYLSSLLLVFVTISFSSYIIFILYGENYQESVKVLVISIFSVPVVYLGALSTRLYLEFDDKAAVLNKALLGLVCNVTLNFFLIPSAGAVGAAISSLAAQVVSGVLCGFFLGENGRKVLNVQLSIILPWRKLQQ